MCTSDDKSAVEIWRQNNYGYNEKNTVGVEYFDAPCA
jgi:hypothetical protein